MYLVVFWSQTGERSLIELFAISTGDETWVTIDTSDQTTLVPGNWESGVGPEFGSHGVRVDAVRAFETNDSWKRNLKMSCGLVKWLFRDAADLSKGLFFVRSYQTLVI